MRIAVGGACISTDDLSAVSPHYLDLEAFDSSTIGVVDDRSPPVRSRGLRYGFGRDNLRRQLRAI